MRPRRSTATSAAAALAALVVAWGPNGPQPVEAFFGWGGGSAANDLEPRKSERFGCVAWKGVAGCDAKSARSTADGSHDAICTEMIGPRQSGYCECAWGETARVDCNHQSFTCQQACYERFPAGEVSEDLEWLKGTVWRWNDWRDVDLVPNGQFLAPTRECEMGDCHWFARNKMVYIMWGNAGLHTVKLDDSKRSLRGMRYDGEELHATLRGRREHDEEEEDDEEEDDGDLDDEDLYEILGLDFEEATDATIKKAFRKLSKEYHPDRAQNSGKDPEEAAKMFEKVRSAYEVLSDADKRLLYDTGGMEAVREYVATQGQEGGGRGMFGMFFGGGGGNRNRDRDAEYTLRVSLADMYKGGKMRTSINRRVVCRGCSKVTDKNRERCSACGKCPPEVRMVQRQMGGFLVNQQEQVASKERCKQEPAKLNVDIEKGVAQGERIVFPRMSDQTPGKIPGDIVIILEQEPNNQFRRDGDNLATVVHPSLKEALTGFSHSFAHLDGHEVEIETDPRSDIRQIIKPFEKRTIRGEGMPRHNVPSESGSLVVEFDIQFPESLSEEQKQRLREILP